MESKFCAHSDDVRRCWSGVRPAVPVCIAYCAGIMVTTFSLLRVVDVETSAVLQAARERDKRTGRTNFIERDYHLGIAAATAKKPSYTKEKAP